MTGDGGNVISIPGERGETREPDIKLVPFNTIGLTPDPPYLVKGLIPAKAFTAVYGAPACGKTFWSFDLEMHVALGWPYRGRKVRQGPVVRIAAEGASGTPARAEAFRQKWLNETDTTEVPLYIVSLALDLVRDHENLIAAIRIALGGEPPALVAIDTLNRTLAGSESNDGDMGRYIRACDRIREELGCGVLVIHHTGIEASRPRGHTSLTGAADCQIKISRDVADNVVATVEKQKDGPDGETITSRLEQVEIGVDDDGDALTSCVIVEAEGTGTPAPRNSQKLTNSERIALTALIEALDAAGAVPPASNHIPANTATVTEDQWRTYAYERGISTGEERAKQQAFKRGHEGLIAKGRVGSWAGYYWTVKS